MQLEQWTADRHLRQGAGGHASTSGYGVWGLRFLNLTFTPRNLPFKDLYIENTIRNPKKGRLYGVQV